ncbi:MAG: neuraminidase-like domain-containing protein [Bacteroidota bacterium]
MKTEFIPMEFDNTNPDHVLLLQNALTFLGYKINEEELISFTIGYTTKEAINEFRKKQCIQGSCELDEKILEALNNQMVKCYHVKGVVTNLKKMPLGGFILKIFRKQIGENVNNNIQLGQTKVLSDGQYILYFNLPYIKHEAKLPEISSIEIIKRFGATIQIYSPEVLTTLDGGTLNPIHVTLPFNLSKIETINNIETEFSSEYFSSVFDDFSEKIQSEIPEQMKFFSREEIIELSKITGIDIENIMKMLLSFYMSANSTESADLTRAYFSFIYQGYPMNKPQTLFPQNELKEYYNVQKYFIEKTKTFLPSEVPYSGYWSYFINPLSENIQNLFYKTKQEWIDYIKNMTFKLMDGYIFGGYNEGYNNYTKDLVSNIMSQKFSDLNSWKNYIINSATKYLSSQSFVPNCIWDSYAEGLAVDILLPKYINEKDWTNYILSLTKIKMGSDLNLDLIWNSFIIEFTDDITNRNFPNNEDWDQYINNLCRNLQYEIILIDKSEQRNIIVEALNKFIINFHTTPDVTEMQITEILNEFEILRKKFSYEEATFKENVSMQDFFNMASTTLDDKAKSEITSMFFDNNADLIEFKKSLLENVIKYGAENVEKTIITFEVGHISNNHSPMIDFVKTELENPVPGEATSVRDLAKYPKSTWETKINALISSGKEGYPEDTPGKTEAEKISNYAEALKLNNEKIYPDVSYIADTDRNNEHGLTYFSTIRDFIYSNGESFDLLVDSIDDKFHPEGSDLEKEEKKNQFKAVQRAFRISPNPKCATTLLENQIHSAGQLYFMGKDNVEAVLKSKGISSEDTDVVFKMATSRYANSLAALTNIKGDLMVGEPNAIVPTIDIDIIRSLQKDFPNLESLFGSLDYCECTHCASVYSSSAYLLDVLSFLNGIQSKKLKPSGQSNYNVREILSQRRRDVESIKLNCTNAETPMPYIDLVNEVFENCVGTPVLIPYQTTLTAKELRAAPEHINYSAYDILKGAQYPIYSSYDMYQHETRTYLDKLGITRHKLLETFLKKNAITPDYTELFVAAEYFQLTDVEKNIINGNDSNIQTRNLQAWNVEILSGSISMSAEEFMKRSGLNCHEMFSLIYHVDWVGLTMSSENAAECSCDNKMITGDQYAFDRANRFIRLYRKSPFEMWELSLLLENSKINPLILNGINLINLMKFDQLRTKLNLKTDQLLAFYSNIYTDIRKDFSIKPILPLYDNLFLKKAQKNPLDENLDLISSPDLETNPQTFENRNFIIITTDSTPDSTPKMDKVEDTIIASLGINADSYEYLLGMISEESGVPVLLIERTFENISFVYRYSLLAKYLKISVQELHLLTKVNGMLNILTPSVPETNVFDNVAETMAFIQKYDKVKKIGINVKTLYYLVNYGYGDSDFVPEFKQQKSTLEVLINELREKSHEVFKKHYVEYSISTNPTDTNSEALIRFLHRIPAFKESVEIDVDFNKLNDIINGTDLILDTIVKKEEFIKSHFADFINSFTEANNFLITETHISAEREAYLLRYLLPYFCCKDLGEFDSFKENSSIEIIKNLISGKWIGEVDQRAYFIKKHFSDIYDTDLITNLISVLTESTTLTIENIVLRSKAILSFLYKYHYQSLIVPDTFRIIAKQFELSAYTSEVMLKELEVNSKSLIEILTEYSFIKLEDNLADIPSDVYNTYYLLSKSCLLVNKTKLTDSQVDWYIVNYKEVFNWSNFKLTNEPNTNDVEKIILMDDISSIASLYPKVNDVSFYDILEIHLSTSALTIAKVSELFAVLCNVMASDVSALLNRFDVAQNSNSYILADTYQRVLNCIFVSSKINCRIEQIMGWYDGLNEMLELTEVKAALKSNYTFDQWLEILPPLQKPIRESKCNALSNYLIEHSQRIIGVATWLDKNDLYAYFLIDPEMTACMITSRIKLAISSVQMFVQRCFLNLEEFVTTDGNKSWDQWKWMKNYRVWEANRKVFLYPENWIEPELRDDKTPLFKELEDELNGGDITFDLAEDVYQSYLNKLDEISKLNVCGIYHEIENDTNLLHVFGRTSSNPHLYYYRVFNGNSGSWNAWEKIDIEIKGEILVPVVYNRRLHLFWLMNIEKSIKPSFKFCSDYSARKSEYDVLSRKVEPCSYNEFQLCWSQLKKGKWTAPKIGKKKIIYNQNNDIQPSGLILTSDITEDNNLILSLYVSGLPKSNNDYYAQGQFIFNGDVVKSSSLYLITLRNDVDVKMWEEIISKMDLSDIPEKIENHIDYKKIEIFQDIENNSLYSKKNLNDKKIENILRFYSAVPILETSFSTPTLSVSFQENPDNIFTCLNINFHKTNFFFNDAGRIFNIQPIIYDVNTSIKNEVTPFYHPFTKLFIRELNRYGIDGILNRDIQVSPLVIDSSNTYDFNTVYNPQNNTYTPEAFQKEVVDFSFGGAYSIYNWELFFHVPLYIADKLSENQKFEDSMKWFHAIFNPMDTSNTSGTQKFWVTKPFYEMSSDEIRRENITNILNNINEFANQVNAWLENPFMPHLVARYRPVAYQRTVVMKYIDNLIAWGDQSFRKDTIESINEATLLYILAYEILGKRPRQMPAKNNPNSGKSFAEILSETTTDITHNPLLMFEDAIRFNFTDNHSGWVMENAAVTNAPLVKFSLSNPKINLIQGREINAPTRFKKETLPRIDAKHFCIPFNDQLLTYWDTVEDRLFKIRHCMNIDGVERQLPLFEPPIDPALLVRAAAMGLDSNDVLSQNASYSPNYRFRAVLQKATEFCSEVKQLGEKILSTIEKRDAESLALLRSSQEINMQQAAKQVRKMQVFEAEENINAQNEAIKMAQQKYDYYSGREYINSLESDAFDKNSEAAKIHNEVALTHLVCAVLSVIPKINTGISGMGPLFSSDIVDGNILAKAVGYGVRALSFKAELLERDASQNLTKAGYQRRKEDWDFQATQATQELVQLNKQLTAADIRKQIAEKELENQDLQIEQLKTTDEYYSSKFTNEELYNWMLKQVTSFYFKSYQMAYDMAKKAEACYKYELGITNNSTGFINFGYWDNAKKGLLAGDKLMYDLHLMDAAYIDNNKRNMELTKHISLAQMFPERLIDIINTGSAFINLPEWLFDMDYPGHYMRRIKSVSISIPNISGPYNGVNCTFTLLNNVVRINNIVSSEYHPLNIDNDSRFTKQFGAIQSIATSHGQNDAGVFELNFNDERYLPFEGAGVISDWKISLPKDTNMFNFSSLSDVIIHINYTARDGGSVLAEAATASLHKMLPKNAAVLLSLKHDFPAEWNEMLLNNSHEMTFKLKPEHLPYFANYNRVDKLWEVMALPNQNPSINGLTINLQSPEETQYSVNITLDNGSFTKLYHTSPHLNSLGSWKLKINVPSPNSQSISQLEDLLFAVILCDTNTSNSN